MAHTQKKNSGCSFRQQCRLAQKCMPSKWLWRQIVWNTTTAYTMLCGICLSTQNQSNYEEFLKLYQQCNFYYIFQHKSPICIYINYLEFVVCDNIFLQYVYSVFFSPLEVLDAIRTLYLLSVTWRRRGICLLSLWTAGWPPKSGFFAVFFMRHTTTMPTMQAMRKTPAQYIAIST